MTFLDLVSWGIHDFYELKSLSIIDASGNPVTQSVVSVTDSSGNPVTGLYSFYLKLK